MVSEAVTEAQAVALRLVGFRADDVYGARIGRVEAVLVDREDGTVQWLNLRLTTFAGGYLAVPLDEMVAGDGNLHFPYERSHLMTAPRARETGPLTSRQERQLCEYFAIGAKTRGAVVSAWERRATSARLIAPGRWEPGPRGPGRGIPADAAHRGDPRVRRPTTDRPGEPRRFS